MFQNFQNVAAAESLPVKPANISFSDENVLNQIRSLNNTLTKLVNDLKSEGNSSSLKNVSKPVAGKKTPKVHHSFPFSPIFSQFGVRFSNANDTSELILKE